MESRNVVFDKVINGAIGDAPYKKGRPFIISNAYLSAYHNHFLNHIDDDLINYCNELNSYFSNNDNKEIIELFNSFNYEQLIDLVEYVMTCEYIGSHREFDESSTASISNIVFQLLNIDGAGHIVADLGSGNGNFLMNTLNSSRRNGYYLKDLIGYEVNVEQAKISQMALSIISNNELNPVIKIGDALEDKMVFFSRGFCFPTIGIRQLIRDKVRQSKLFPSIEFTNRNTSDWVYVDHLLSGMIDGGKAVAIVSGRALFNHHDKEYRNALINKGLLEGIIELPNGSLNFTGIKPYVLVFSKGNASVKLINATDSVDKKTKRFNKVEILTDDIINKYNNPNSPKKEKTELINCNNLMPSSLLLDVSNIKNGVRLEDIADVFTGNQYTLGVFEKNGLLTTEKTGYRILISSDIEDGLVDWQKLRSIKQKDDKFDKYAVKKNDIVVTSKSSKVKTVVVDVDPKDKILVTGGMIIIRPNSGLIDSTYLKIYLDSNQGQNSLKSIQKGTAIISINAKDLSTIQIPLIEIDKQIHKAKAYNEKLSMLYALKQKIKHLEDSIKNFYLDESEDE